MKRLVMLSLALTMLVLVGCATAKLSPDDLAKVNSGQLVRVETENQETMIKITVAGEMSEAAGRMHDLRIRVKAIDGTSVYRKLGDASQVFALTPGSHRFDYECTHNITVDGETKKHSRLGNVEIELKRGSWYQLRSRATRDVCRFVIIENQL